MLRGRSLASGSTCDLTVYTVEECEEIAIEQEEVLAAQFGVFMVFCALLMG